ncbi:hypothetical protein GII33_06525 [Gordonia pseudamarae]|uniref:Secreted protein n=1 Tax=Gordonia pseudamarae TaxID=2831662 RepID=A0ABX6IQW6_9ACTN|nr:MULTISPECIES: hypothetical protein [Gordonia]QHN28526.1 hypothetical protein GII33_06525 [Gordonia pseudamarae]QHN37393.1 hypothetical protein GII31_06505 [Gordonia pseudamarae]
MTTALQSAALILAEENPEGPEFGKSSPFGLLIIILLLVGTALLIWSMNSQLKKLPKSFDADHPEADQAFDEGTDSAGAGSAAGDAADLSADADPPRQDPSHQSVPHKSADM